MLLMKKSVSEPAADGVLKNRNSIQSMGVVVAGFDKDPFVTTAAMGLSSGVIFISYVVSLDKVKSMRAPRSVSVSKRATGPAVSAHWPLLVFSSRSILYFKVGVVPGVHPPALQTLPPPVLKFTL